MQVKQNLNPSKGSANLFGLVYLQVVCFCQWHGDTRWWAGLGCGCTPRM